MINAFCLSIYKQKREGYRFDMNENEYFNYVHAYDFVTKRHSSNTLSLPNIMKY